jgi:hypothetical protein
MGVSRTVRAILCLEAIVLLGLGLVVADQLAHKRVQMLAGVNSWGYRGAIMPMQRGAEWRVAVVGGDRAFGWGVGPEEAMPAYLRTELSRQVTGDAPVMVANLGAIGLPAHDYDGRIRAFSYLRPDVVCLYVDLRDRSNAALLPRHDSGVTAATGYVPMLPLLFRDKGVKLAADGHTWLGSSASAMSTSLTAIDRVLYALVASTKEFALDDRSVSLGQAVEAALDAAPQAVVVLPMPLDDAERQAHEAARARLSPWVAAEPRLQLVDLRETTGLADPVLRLDGFHYGAAGHSMAATAIAPAVLMALSRSRPKV